MSTDLDPDSWFTLWIVSGFAFAEVCALQMLLLALLTEVKKCLAFVSMSVYLFVTLSLCLATRPDSSYLTTNASTEHGCTDIGELFCPTARWYIVMASNGSLLTTVKVSLYFSLA